MRNSFTKLRNFSRNNLKLIKPSSKATFNNVRQLSEVNHTNSVQVLNDSHVSVDKIGKKRSKPLLLPSDFEREKINNLKESLIASKNVESLFNIYFANKNMFDQIMYLVIVKKISELHKTGYISTDDLQNNESFLSLCYDIWKIISQMESYIALSIYKNLLSIGINSNYLIMQSLLQMIRHQINKLTIHELTLLNTVLNKTEACNLKKALQLALPTVVDNSLNHHFPSSLKYKEYMQLLQIGIGGEIESLGSLLNHIYQYSLPELLMDEESNTFDLDIISLLSNVLTLFSKENLILSKYDSEVAKKLLIICLEKLGESELKNVDQKLILAILTKLALNFVIGNNRQASDENFLSRVAQKVSQEEWDVLSAYNVIHLQQRLHYINEELINYFLSSISVKHFEIDAKFMDNIPYVVSALAASDQHVKSHGAVNCLMEMYEPPFQNMNIPWIRFVLDLLFLNHFPRSLLSTILDEKFLFSYLEQTPSNKLLECLDVLRLQRVLKSSQWAEEGMTVPDKVLSRAQKVIYDRPAASLQGLLEPVLGTRVLPNVITPQQNYVDHLIVVDDNGILPLIHLKEKGDSTYTTLSEWEKFDGKRKIALMEIPDTWTYKPESKLRGTFKWDIRLIEEEGVQVVLLHEQQIVSQRAENAADIVRNILNDVRVKLPS